MISKCIEHILDTLTANAAITVTSVVLITVYFIVKDWGIPPGPIGLPYIGYWPFLSKKNIHLQLQSMGKRYGDVFSFRVSGQLYINLGTVRDVREVQVTNSECFTERPTDFSFTSYVFKEGVILLNGEPWRVLRKFFVQCSKEYGMMGLKEDMVGPIHETLNATIDYLRERNGKPINILELLSEKCTRIVRRMLFNDDGISEVELGQVIEAYALMVEHMVGRNMLLCGTFARKVLFPFISGYHDIMSKKKYMEDILQNVVQRHESTFHENQVRDIIDSYIQERNNRISKNDPTAQYFTNNSLVSSLIQFVGDGILSVAYLIGLFLHSLIKYPEEQEKIYKEILSVIGPDRQPTLYDRKNLPYTNAFLLEVLRTPDVLFLFPNFTCTKETTLRGYRIPKGAATFVNVYTAHHDPEIFEEPYRFNPSRYLSSPGKKKPELPVTFGMGKRACAGEAFTMMQAFLFVTTLINNFRMALPEGAATKSIESLLSGNMEVCAHIRA